MHWHSLAYHDLGIALWVLIIVLAAMIVMALRRPKGEGQRTIGEDPEQILKRRYAQGEIDRETYQRMLGDLRRDSRQRPG